MKTNPEVNEKLVAFPSGIYLIDANLLDTDMPLPLEERHNVSFEVMEAMVNFLMLQQTMEILLTLDEGVKYSLKLVKEE